ncbi:MAG: C10 family peptidase [Bacteroidales bacterium]|nr:C10 family peptidase [Bacteroidales bacterium]
MRIRSLLFFMLFVLIANFVTGGEVTVEKAKQAALAWMSQVNPEKSSIFIENVNSFSYEGYTTAYIFSFSGGGFVIIAAEDNIEPVLAYSEDSPAKPDNANPVFQNWMQTYNKQIHKTIIDNIIDKSAQKKWGDLSNNSYQKKLSKSISPLLKTKWNQDCYYNAACPSDSKGPCSHVYVGCVATAMGQIMKYWNFPPTGKGSKSFTHSTYGKLSVDFSAATYDWTQMPNSLSSSNAEVAKILYHCGVSVSMNYASDGSGAYDEDAATAFSNYFNYEKTNYLYKSYYKDTTWLKLIKTELNAGRPVFYSGADYNYGAGHAFVCDGYNDNNYFHFNWGWSGNYDGYFLLSALNPTGYDFTSEQSAIINIKPTAIAPVADFTSNINSLTIGSSVNFTDKSTNSPLSWYWQFTGGTPAASTSQNPQNIKYNTAGTYPVSLTVTNSYGSNTNTKTAYIKVYSDELPPCDTLNYPLDGTAVVYKFEYGGYISGTNYFKDKVKADYVATYPTGKLLTGAYILFGKAKKNASTDQNVTVSVWSNTGTNGAPNTVLTSTTVKMSKLVDDLSVKRYTYVEFPTPYTITAPFYLGVNIPATTGDSIAICTTKDQEVEIGTAWEKWSDNTWHNYTESNSWNIRVSHFMFPVFCEPQADFSAFIAKDTTVCKNSQLNLKVTVKGGKSPYSYKWSDNTTKDNISIQPALTTTYTITVTDAEQKTATAKIVVNVRNTVKISVQPSNQAICEGKSASFSVTASDVETYLWQSSPDGLKFNDIPNANKVNFVLAAAGSDINLYKYRCILTGKCGEVITSDAATLTVKTDCNNCDTLNFPLKGSMGVYRTYEGWVTGTNEYDMPEYAQYFSTYPANTSITSIFFIFGYPVGNVSHEVTVAIWGNTGSNGKPGATPIATKKITLGKIIEDYNKGKATEVVFDSPVEISNAFYAGIILPSTAGDSLAIVSNQAGSANPCNAWVKYGGIWGNFSYVWQNYYNFDLAIFPVFCDKCSLTAPKIQVDGETDFCEGSSTLLYSDVGAGLTYQWKKNNINISGATASAYTVVSQGDYSLEISKTEQCSALSASLTVNVNPLPVVNLGADTTITNYDIITLQARTGYDKYIWNDGSVESSLEIDGAAINPGTHNYSVTVIDSKGCRNSDDINITVIEKFFKLSGSLLYNNGLSSQMSAKINLLKEGNIIGSTTTDKFGAFRFLNLAKGSYSLAIEPVSTWGGNDPIDALICIKNYLGLLKISDELKRKAADVDNDKKISPLDALYINRRYIKIIKKFPAQDWLFDKQTFNIIDSDIILNIKANCAGDVNGSYLPE